jgi:hypothetical protein
MKRRHLNIVIAAAGLASAVAFWLSFDGGAGRNIICRLFQACPPVVDYLGFQTAIYDLSVGGITSVFFYGLLVALPEQRKRKRYKDALLRSYKIFKEDCISTILGAEKGVVPMDLLNALQEQEEFRRYFKQQWSDDLTRWDRFLNELAPHHLRDMANSMSAFREDLSITIHAIEVDDEEVFALLTRLTHAIANNQNTTLDYDDVKGFARFLWWLFAGWSIVDGYADQDQVEATIRAL